MLEQGIVLLVNAASAVTDIALAGGFDSEIPKDSALPSWSYLIASEVEDTGLTTSSGLCTTRLQIDSYGNVAAEAINLSRAIHNVLQGFAGRLSDPDTTFVGSCFRIDHRNFFDDARRSYRRMTEYEILHA